MNERRCCVAMRLIWLLSIACGLQSCGPVSAGEQTPHYAEHQNLLYYLDAAGKRHPIRSKQDWAIRRRHILENMQIVMGRLPHPKKKVPLNVRTLETKTVGTIVRKKIVYHTDSLRRVVSAYLFLPNTDGRKVPAVLCLHQTTRIGKMEPAGLGGRPNLRYALELAQRGYVTLAPDYPSFGDYRYDFPPGDGYTSGTMKAIYDNIRAVDLLVSLREVAPKRIGCIGHSLGGHNTMFTAAFEPRIRAMVSSCGFTRFHKYYNGRLKGWTSSRYMPLINSRYQNNPDRVPFDFTEIVASFAPRPFFSNSPLHDSNFEVSGVRDVFKAARPVYALYGAAKNLQVVYPDSGHDFPPASRKAAYKFFDRHLQHTPPRTSQP